jgi:hypothetical protein
MRPGSRGRLDGEDLAAVVGRRVQALGEEMTADENGADCAAP